MGLARRRRAKWDDVAARERTRDRTPCRTRNLIFSSECRSTEWPIRTCRSCHRKSLDAPATASRAHGVWFFSPFWKNVVD